MNSDDEENLDDFLKHLKAKAGQDKMPALKAAPIKAASTARAFRTPIISQNLPEPMEENPVSLDDMVKDLRKKVQTQPPLLDGRTFGQMIRQVRKLESKMDMENGKTKSTQKTLADNTNGSLGESNTKSTESEQTPVSKPSPSLLEIIEREKLRRETHKKDSKAKSRIFLNEKKFCFIPFGMGLVKECAEKMTQFIKRKGGLVIPISSLAETNPDEVIIITTKYVKSFEALKQLLPNNLTNPENYQYIDSEWISRCMKINEIVDRSSYCLNLSEGIENMNENLKKSPFIKLTPLIQENINQNTIAPIVEPVEKVDESLISEQVELNKDIVDSSLISDQVELNKDIADSVGIIDEENKDDDNKDEDNKDEDNKDEYSIRKDIQTTINKLRTDDKIKRNAENTFLYDYLHETHIAKLNEVDNEIKK